MPDKINQTSFKETVEYGLELFKKKNEDYGNSVEKSIEKYGLRPNLIRLDDKLNRANTLLLNQRSRVKSESLYDTLVDLGNYAYMLATYVKALRGQEGECCGNGTENKDINS